MLTFEQRRLRPLLKMNQAKIKVRIDNCKVNSDISWQWNTTFVGQKMAHNYWLYYLIDGIMADNPQLESIVELGTGDGALTTFLGLWGIKRHIRVLTVDWDSVRSLSQKEVLDRLDVIFLNANLIVPDTQEKIALFVGTEPTFLIVDGGNKDREFNLYASQLAAGSIIGVHDYQTEWFMKDVQEVADKYCEPYNEDNWNSMNVRFATFLRK